MRKEEGNKKINLALTGAKPTKNRWLYGDPGDRVKKAFEDVNYYVNNGGTVDEIVKSAIGLQRAVKSEEKIREHNSIIATIKRFVLENVEVGQYIGCGDLMGKVWIHLNIYSFNHAGAVIAIKELVKEGILEPAKVIHRSRFGYETYLNAYKMVKKP